jgi:hypothetical protein
MRTAFIGLAFLLHTVASSAASVTDTYVIPVAGHVSGANGQTWMTDVTLHNVTSSSLVIDLATVGAGGQPIEMNAETVTVAAHGTLMLRDVVRQTAVGALVVAGSGPFTMTSRVYSEGARGSVGSDVAPVNEFLGSDSGDAFLPGLIANARYRTNLGFFAIADATVLQLEITLLDAAGIAVGSRLFEFPAGTLSHRHINSRDIAPMEFEAATARIRVVSGDGVVAAYGSVVDNVSSDASFVPAALGQQPPASLLRQQSMLRRSCAGGRYDRWGSRQFGH